MSISCRRSAFGTFFSTKIRIRQQQQHNYSPIGRNNVHRLVSCFIGRTLVDDVGISFSQHYQHKHHLNLNRFLSNGGASASKTSASSSSSSTTAAAAATLTKNALSNVGRLTIRPKSRVLPRPKNRTSDTTVGLSGTNRIFLAGVPLILFALLSAWVVSNAYGGKLRELEASQGKVSMSIRQAALEEEHDEMMERLTKIVAEDFDNTKRIKRPEEILEERRKERERRNVWYRRMYRWVLRKTDDNV